MSVFAWCALTLASAAVHAIAWSTRGDAAAAESVLGESACKLAANVSQVLTLPGWIVMWLGFGLFESGWSAAAAGAIGWSTLLVGIWCVAGARWWVRSAPARAPRPGPIAANDSGTHLPTAAMDDARARAAGVVSRRAFLLDGAIVSGALIGGAGVAHATLIGPWSLVVRRCRVPMRDLPAALDGFRMVQISDTHLGPRIPRAFIRRVVQRACELKPDLFVLTGDYVHMGRSHIAPAAELFRPLLERGRSALGAVGVLGNHDFYADGPAMAHALESIGVRMIDNDRVFVEVIDGGRRLTSTSPTSAGLCVAGLGDLLEDRIDPRRALRDVPPGMPRIVLAHNPDTAESPIVTGVSSVKFYPADPPRSELGEPGWTAARIDLMLSGHTHGGQVRIPLLGTPGIPSRFGQKYARGLVQGPICPVLVSAGVGMSVLPVRIGVPPELVEVELVRDGAA